MLQIENPQSVLVGETEPQLSIREYVGIGFAFLRRRYLSILIFLLPAVAFGALYLYAERPTFTASATMMMETHRGGLLQQSILGDGPADVEGNGT